MLSYAEDVDSEANFPYRINETETILEVVKQLLIFILNPPMAGRGVGCHCPHTGLFSFFGGMGEAFLAY